MEAAINYGLCRCCASEGSFKDLEKTYDWLGTEEVYANMLKDCFDISLSKQDSFNNGGICEVCITQLRNASNFKKQVQQTEQQFLKKIEDNGYQTSIIKVEVARPDDDDHDLFDDGNLSDGFSSPEYDIPLTKIKVEKLNETKPKKRAAKPSTSKAKKLKKEAGEPSAKRSRVIILKLENSSKKEIENKSIKIKKFINFKKSSTLRNESELDKHRHNLKVILESSNATPIRCQAGLCYRCCFCEEQYYSPADLKMHNLESHAGFNESHFLTRVNVARFVVKLDIAGLICKLCLEPMDSLEILIGHLQNIHKKIMYNDIPKQIIPFKLDSENFTCCICSSQFSRFKILVEHMHVHFRNYCCDVCNAGYVTRSHLQLHSETHKLGSFSCGQCSKVFKTVANKISHENYAHGSEKQRLMNVCPFCKERFNCGRKRDRHVQQEHGFLHQTLKCQACEKTFTNQAALTTHRQRDHLMLKRFKCTQCDKNFFTGHELKTHMVKHTGVKEFVCEVCLKAYGRRKTLIEHLRIHADDRRFKCEHCGQAFVQKCSWRGHMRAKHGEDV